MDNLQHLFDRNKVWSDAIKKDNPHFFSQLCSQQTPEYLWIGCADSRVPANQIVDLPPGDVFVHRNIANVVVHTDLNCLSVIQYAVEVLKVKHIIVCGHYGCGGINAAMDKRRHGLVDNWLRHVKDVSRFHQDELALMDEHKRADRLCELNVIEQVKNVGNATVVQNAWEKGADLSLHGWVYDIKDGMLRDLNMFASSNAELQQKCMETHQ